MSLGLYLHIPYCFSKCRYCDFYSHPGERGVPEAYVDALLRELSRFNDSNFRRRQRERTETRPRCLLSLYPNRILHAISVLR